MTQKQNLILQTSTNTKGIDYLPYLDDIKARTEEKAKLRTTSIEGEPRWSRFLLHGVPTSVTMDEVAISIQQSHPGVLNLAQTPRWLTTDLKRQTSGKGMSTAVLAIAGKHTLQSLGYQFLFVCNSRCRLDRYLPFGPSSPNQYVPRAEIHLRCVRKGICHLIPPLPSLPTAWLQPPGVLLRERPPHDRPPMPSRGV